MKGLVTGHDLSRAEDTAQTLKAFFQTFQNGAPPLLLLDYDGTLAPFRKDRFKARPYAGVRDILAQIQQQGSTRIAFITGRPASEIPPLIGLENLEVWGLHGAEHLYPDGRREVEELPEATREKLSQLRQQLHQDSFGGLFEDKPNAAVMHWRGATTEKAAQIREKSLALLAPLASPSHHPGGLTLLEFESGIELRAGRDKGSAVAAILKESDPNSPVVFLGDDFTDESAFHAINSLAKNGLSILVRKSPRQTKAQLWLRPPSELKSFLKSWQTHSRNLPPR